MKIQKGEIMDLDQQGSRLRPSRVTYYMDIAHAVSQRATCLRRKFGAIIVQNDTIVSTGYNGAARGATDCLEKGKCLRQELNVPAGEKYELCVSIHAEMNAIISASPGQMKNAIMCISGQNMDDGSIAESYPCIMCRRMIVNAGISCVMVNTPIS